MVEKGGHVAGVEPCTGAVGAGAGAKRDGHNRGEGAGGWGAGEGGGTSEDAADRRSSALAANQPATLPGMPIGSEMTMALRLVFDA
jgi:hypothetical protein